MANFTVSANVDSMLQAADYSAVKTLLSLNNVENTALSTYAGSASLSFLVSNLSITHSALTYAATTDLDFAGDGIKTVALTGNVTFTTSNKADGRSLAVRIQSDGSVRALAFPAGWKFFGATPVSIAGSKEALLALQCFGAAETDVRAMYNVEP